MSLDKDIKKLDNKRFGAAIKDTECSHEKWTKRCSICATIIETEINVHTEGATKQSRPEFEKLVTSYTVSQDLKHIGVNGKSALYWVHFISSDHKCIRSKENLTLNNTEIYPAFTVQELCVMLKTVDADSDTILDNLDSPDSLGMMLHAIYNFEGM